MSIQTQDMVELVRLFGEEYEDLRAKQQALWDFRDELQEEIHEMRPENVMFVGNEFFIKLAMKKEVLERLLTILNCEGHES